MWAGLTACLHIEVSMLIECIKGDKVLTDSGRQTLDKYLEKLKPGDLFYLKPINKSEVRSIQQSEYYWAVILPALQYYADFLDFCPDPKTDKEVAHYAVKLNYCLLERDDLIKKIKVRNPIDKKIVTRYIPFSWKMSEMPAKEATQYIDWCKKMIEKHSGVDFDTAIRSM